MKHIFTKSAILISCTLLIVGSGGGAAGAGNYEPFNSTATKTSTLSGTALQIGGATFGRKLINVSGSVTHDSGKISVKDSTYTLTDSDGADANKVISDGTSSLTYSADFAGDYKFASAYFQTYKDGSNFYDVNGIIGVATDVSDIPSANSVTYTGDAQAIVITSTTGHDLKTGKSEIIANFATAKVNVTLNGFTSIDQTSGLTDFAPIDEIKISNMSISGNQFSNGSISTNLSGISVDLVGSNSSSTAQGSFFGYDATKSIPAEVGGHVLIQGDSAIVSGSFLAK